MSKETPELSAVLRFSEQQLAGGRRRRLAQAYVLDERRRVLDKVPAQPDSEAAVRASCERLYPGIQWRSRS